MSSQFAISEQLLSAGRDQHLLPNNCLKRKLEAVDANGFAPAAGHEMPLQEHECSHNSEKRQRFSDHSTHVYDANRQEICMNGDGLNYFSTDNNGDICPNISQNGNNVGADSLLQNNLEYHTSNVGEEIAEMDIECETFDTSDCPPNSNEELESSPAKGSPAREFLLKHRPEYHMHCIPSYCHPGGLWDVMLEVYHGL